MTSTQTAALVAEIERLNECLRYEQHRAGRRGTHGTDCYKWGPEHYECAMRQVERLTRELAVAKCDNHGEYLRGWNAAQAAMDADAVAYNAVLKTIELCGNATGFPIRIGTYVNARQTANDVVAAMWHTDAGAKTG